MYIIYATYRISSKVEWGSLDEQIEKAFNGNFGGCGTSFGYPMTRDYSGTRKTKNAVKKVTEKLKKN